MTPNEYTFRYRVRNWPAYNQALISRGRLTFWFDEEAVVAWRNTDPQRGRGAPRVYSETAIQCALVLKSVFHLSLRATQGFLSSLLELLRLEPPVPDYSTLSRRQGSVVPSLSVGPGVRPRHVGLDATGLKVYGAGEWHVRKHRRGRRRAWRKLHLGVDETTKEIVAVEVTPGRIHDSSTSSGEMCRANWRVRRSGFDSCFRTPSSTRFSFARLSANLAWTYPLFESLLPLATSSL